MSTNEHNSPAAVLGATIRRRRRALQLNQDAVADLAGVSRRFLSQLENGKATVRLAELLAVLQVLGLGLRVGPGQGDVRVEDG